MAGVVKGTEARAPDTQSLRSEVVQTQLGRRLQRAGRRGAFRVDCELTG